jgi:uncharacterized protein YecT (DUF1311 family)
MRKLFGAALVTLLLAAAARSQELSDKKPAPPPDPCPASTTEMERTQCWEQLAAKAQADLTALYRQLEGRIRARIAKEQQSQLKTYRETVLQKLKAAQLAWSRYRDGECDAREQQFEGGTIAPSVHAGCVKELSERRMADLQKTYAIYFRE